MYVLWFILPKNCLKKQIGLPDRYPALPVRTHINHILSQIGVSTPKICIVNGALWPPLPIDPLLSHQKGVGTKILGLQIAAKPLQIATWSLLTALSNALSNDTIADTLQISVMHVARQYSRLSQRQLSFLPFSLEQYWINKFNNQYIKLQTTSQYAERCKIAVITTRKHE